MKVLIDEGLSTLQQLGGIGYFSVNLWQHLQKFIQCDITDYHYLRTLPRVARRAFYIGLANLEVLKHRYDVIHYQNYYVPSRFGTARRVATIHDLYGFTSPGFYPAWYSAYHRRVLHRAIGRADAVTLSSFAVREELLSLFPGVDETRAYVCHQGLRSVFLDFLAFEESLTPLNLKPYSYFLFVGNLERRKNLAFLLSRFAEARKRSLIGDETKLVLVGKVGVGYEEFQHLLTERDNIIYLGRLGDEEIVALYKFCKAFVFPSLYEGFGVPIIEAMSQKVPILISNIPSSLELHKRHNNQCLVFELGRDDIFMEMLSHLDKNFACVAATLNYGDLALYSYDRVAQEHLRVYSQIL